MINATSIYLEAIYALCVEGLIYDKSFINGEFVNEREDAKVSYEDRGYVFGDGIYEYIRAYDGKLFTVKEHFERFLRVLKK